MATRLIHLNVECRLDAASRVQQGHVTIDRQRGVMTVRRKRSSKAVWHFELNAAVEILVHRAIRIAASKQRLEKANAVRERKRQQREQRKLRQAIKGAKG